MRKIIYVLCLLVFLASCQKYKLEKLSGAWEHQYEIPPVGVFIDRFDCITFTCDSFMFKRISPDDVYYTNCSCNYTEDWIRGTYTIQGNILELKGYYVDSIFFNPSVRSDIGPNYYQKFNIYLQEIK